MTGIFRIPSRGIRQALLWVSVAVCLPPAPGQDAPQPLFSFGVITDTHVYTKYTHTASKVGMALALFKRQGVELVIHNGDICDWNDPAAYELYRKTADAVYAGGATPVEIFNYAWHDAFAFEGHPRTAATTDAPAAFALAAERLKDSRKPTDVLRFKGYTFINFPQFVGHGKPFISHKEYEKIVAKACAENPGRPVFVIDHVPPENTVYCTEPERRIGNAKSREILNRYPQVVCLTGHIHGSLRNDIFIWQDQFTVVNAGCLQHWHGVAKGSKPVYKEEYGALTCDVFTDKLVFRRWDVRDGGAEIDPEHRWIIPVPFDAATAPWNRARRRAAEPRPFFPEGTAIAITTETRDGLRVKFPDLQGAFLYRLTIERQTDSGAWQPETTHELYSNFWMPEKNRPREIDYLFPAGSLPTSGRCRISVTPLNQYGDAGRPCVSPAVRLPACDARGRTAEEKSKPLSS